MLEEYVEFNIVRFLKESKGWKGEIAELKKELEQIPLIPIGENQGGGRSSLPSDNTGNIAISRMAIISKIEKIEKKINTLSQSLERLYTIDQDVINLFFFSKNSVWAEIDKYALAQGISRSIVYQRRRIALENLTEILKSYE